MTSCFEHLRKQLMGNDQEKRIIGVQTIIHPIPPISHNFLSLLLMLQKKWDMVEDNNFSTYVSDISSAQDSSLPLYVFSSGIADVVPLPCSLLPTVMIKKGDK